MACIGAAGDDAEVGARLFERTPLELLFGQLAPRRGSRQR